ncbi:MAG TPA: hypothetical protein VG326_16575 [Tepidisphaeraceae bacterium]|jgi:ABC-type transport system involved in multi-copper enzyme maturation permease subunit|nr:hypothetical protein [Tepidisphaeraceae bacterium]
MRQTVALIVDAYRELNYKKLFWITLILSAVVVLSFLGVNINDHGLIIFGKAWPVPHMAMLDRAVFYRLLFLVLGVDIWLTWAATILALVSTAGIFPDLLTGGSIDLYLSKPISRLRFFLSKYFTGLLFVGLQVGAFSAASFIVLAIRGQVWIWGVFLAIPIVLVFYSYLYCVCVLLGVLTRSTLTAILLTILLWLVITGVHAVEMKTLSAQFKDGYVRERIERRIENEERNLIAAQKTYAQTLRESRVSFSQKKIETFRQDLRENAADIADDRKWHGRLFLAKTLLPKTSETVALMQRWLASTSAIHGSNPEYERALTEDEPRQIGFGRNTDDERAEEATKKQVLDRPISWVVGTSLLFEIAIVSLAAWIFCRRDY